MSQWDPLAIHNADAEVLEASESIRMTNLLADANVQSVTAQA